MRISDWSSDVCSSDLSCETTRSMTPPASDPRPRLGANESSSSKNNTQGAFFLASSNVTRTFRSGSPTYMSSNSGPFTEIKLMSHRSEEHTSELQSLMRISNAIFCFKKKIYRNHYI